MANTIPYENRETPKDEKETKGYKVKKFFSVLLTVVFIIAMAIGAFVIFHSTYYVGVFVNGQSMYPTLNLNAKDQNGNIVGSGGGSSQIGYRVEYGIIDAHGYAINNIKRGDIVVVYYPSDYDSEGELINGAYSKIKRVVGFEGETIGLNTKGELLVNGKETKLRGKRHYDDGDLPTSDITYTYEIGENEYFLMGDNRSHSTDSRSVGPIKKEYIIGVLVAIEGTCRIIQSKKDPLKHDCDSIVYSWPKFSL